MLCIEETCLQHHRLQPARCSNARRHEPSEENLNPGLSGGDAENNVDGAIPLGTSTKVRPQGVERARATASGSSSGFDGEGRGHDVPIIRLSHISSETRQGEK